MERSVFRPPANAVQRFRELDAAIRVSGWTLTAVCALVSLAFWNRSPLLVLAGWMSLGWRGTRVFIRSDLDLYRWGIGSGLISGASVVLASTVTGGLSSPIVLFTMVVGLVTSTSFTHQPFWGFYPVALVATIGAIDVVAGGVRSVDLLLAVTVIIVTLAVPRLITDMVAVELSYRKKAVLDPLTGCLNRTSMDIRTNELQHQAAQTGDDIGVIAIDIDRFKSINDQFGHSVGDEVLQQVAYAIRRNLRRFELLYRTGGEEFVLLLPGADRTVTYTLGEKIRTAIEEEKFLVGQVTISLGVASQHAPSDLEALIELADQSLLEAKKTGRNRTVAAPTG